MEVGEGPTATGRYTVGPAQATTADREEWLDVPGTTSEETVVGADTGT